MHAWNPAQPNPQPCPPTHASPQLITQEALERATKFLRTSNDQRMRTALAKMDADRANDDALDAKFHKLEDKMLGALQAKAPAPSPTIVPEGQTLIGSAELLTLKLNQAKAEERERILREGAPVAPGMLQVSLLASSPMQIPLMLPYPPPTRLPTLSLTVDREGVRGDVGCTKSHGTAPAD